MKSRPLLVMVANEPEALVRVCGVTMMDRLLRTLQRSGFNRAIVLTVAPEAIRAELFKPSWARSGIDAEVRSLSGASLTFSDLDRLLVELGASPLLLVFAGGYFDPRLIDALLLGQGSTALIDSNPEHLDALGRGRRKETRFGVSCGAFLLEAKLIKSKATEVEVVPSLTEQIATGQVAVLDVASIPSFVVSMRRHIRPLWFPAPTADALPIAQALVLDTAQKGAMEMISYLETPIENWVMRRLWNTSVTPTQITLFGLVVGVGATIAFALGHLWIGGFFALSVGVIDGLDGKQARVKVETTEFGRWEGELDYPVQMSWWIALAWYFSRTIAESHAIRWVVLFLIADVVDKLFTRWVKTTTGRYLENHAWIDGVIRFFGGPRSLYVCMLICGLILKQPYRAFVLICGWHVAICCLHGLRAVWICTRKRQSNVGTAGETASFG